MSATVYALVALQAAGLPSSDASMTAARQFVYRLQNALHAPGTRQTWHDYGFFFVNGDPVRNKAGVVRHGDVATFRSYGSTTADGLYALSITPPRDFVPDNSHQFRLLRAIDWFNQHFLPDQVPGDYPPDRVAARNGVYFYYAASVARAYRHTRSFGRRDEIVARHAQELADAIIGKQRDDG
jgi:hypothetical protein